MLLGGCTSMVLEPIGAGNGDGGASADGAAMDAALDAAAVDAAGLDAEAADAGVDLDAGRLDAPENTPPIIEGVRCGVDADLDVTLRADGSEHTCIVTVRDPDFLGATITATVRMGAPGRFGTDTGSSGHRFTIASDTAMDVLVRVVASDGIASDSVDVRIRFE